MTAAGRVRWRLRLRDLAAASAFAAMAVSGSVPVWATAAFLLAFGLSMAGLRPLSGRAAWSVIVLMIAAMALFGSAIAGGLDLVIAACTFAALITGHRLIAAPSANTDNQVHLTSLLMISGGAALSGELLFGVCLTAFAAFSSLSLGMGVLEAATPEGDEVPVRPALRQIGLGVVAMLVGALVFFVLFPRLSWNVAARRPAPGLGVATTGFSDRVRLQGGGDIKSNPRAVLRARLGPDPSQSRLDAYWLGRTFDAFNGREWSGSGKPSTPKGQVRLAPLSGRTVRQEIELLPAYEARTLVALETPAVFSNAVAFTGAAPTRISLIEVPGEEVRVGQSSLGYRYQAFSVDGPQPLDEGGDLARYRALPKSIDRAFRRWPRGWSATRRIPSAPRSGSPRTCSASSSTRSSWAKTSPTRLRTSCSFARKATASTSPPR